MPRANFYTTLVATIATTSSATTIAGSSDNNFPCDDFNYALQSWVMQWVDYDPDHSTERENYALNWIETFNAAMTVDFRSDNFNWADLVETMEQYPKRRKQEWCEANEGRCEVPETPPVVLV